MSTAIEWTDEVFNPVVGCRKVSEGCRHCYAKTLHDQRHKAFHAGKKMPAQYEHPFEHVQLKPERLKKPFSWRKPRRVFVNSVSDLFHEDVPFDYIDKVWLVMAYASTHTFQILTKRPERMLEYVTGLRADVGRLKAVKAVLDDPWLSHYASDASFDEFLERVGNPVPNVWLGVSVENQAAAETRIPLLLETPATIRFLSCEPLLGEVNLRYIKTANGAIDSLQPQKDAPRIHWVIAGGESGNQHRPMNLDWARSLRDQCSRTPFFFKQVGGRTPKAGGRLLDGRTHDEFPRARRNEEVAA